MNSGEIYDYILRIQDNASKSVKETLIAAKKDDEEFKKVLTYAYDPFVRFGIANVEFEGKDEIGYENFSDDTWHLLDDLANKRLTGGDARTELRDELKKLNYYSQILLVNIIKKDLRAGFDKSTINKAIPGLVATFDCMLAHKFDASRVKKWPQVVEVKLDGVRVLAFVKRLEGKVTFVSRSGKEFNTFEHLKQPIIDMVNAFTMARGKETSLMEVVFDGEVVSGSFNKTVSEVRRKDEQAVDAEFHIFDVLPGHTFKKDDKDGCEVANVYKYRRQLLEAIVEHTQSTNIKTTPKYLVNSLDEIMAIYNSVRARGLEGLIVKHPEGLYHRRRNHGWMKIKNEESVDVPIVDVEEGTGKYEGMLGALVVDVDGVRVNVGSGLSDIQREVFWEDRDVLIGRLIEVEYHEKTPDGSLRHPRFVRFRDDKEEA